MQTLKKCSDNYRPYKIEDKEILDIYFYNEKGIICSANKLGQDTYLKDSEGNDSPDITVKDIKILDFLTTKTINEVRVIKNSYMYHKENFYVPYDSTYLSKVGQLYLYVDNDNIKYTGVKATQSSRMDKWLNEELSITTTFTFDISSQICTVTSHSKKDGTSEYSDTVRQFVDFMEKRVTGSVRYCDVAELFNYFDFVKRDKPLTKLYNKRTVDITDTVPIQPNK